MLMTKTTKRICAILMAIMMTHLPAQVLANDIQSGRMIATQVMVEEMSRSNAETQIHGLLTQDEVQSALEKQGLSKEEINQRLASLSDLEIKQLAQQMEQSRYGGDILVTVLLVILIIFLLKRL